MLVDAQYLGTNWRLILTRAPLQAAEEIALHGSGPNLLAAPQTTAVDAVQVLLKDHFLKAFTSSLERLNAGNLLAKAAATIQAATFADLELEQTVPKAPVVMPDRSPTPALMP
jgi:ABC-type nitrate/sulfonate/bicarbonate transport system permease component